jgi:hypothetical protein
LLAHRELDDALGLTTMAGEMLAEARTGRNGRHALVGLFRQSVFGRLAGYEDVADSHTLGNNTPETGLPGWGTWIRTKIDGVRVRCSTISRARKTWPRKIEALRQKRAAARLDGERERP